MTVDEGFVVHLVVQTVAPSTPGSEMNSINGPPTKLNGVLLRVRAEWSTTKYLSRGLCGAVWGLGFRVREVRVCCAGFSVWGLVCQVWGYGLGIPVLEKKLVWGFESRV